MMMTWIANDVFTMFEHSRAMEIAQTLDDSASTARLGSPGAMDVRGATDHFAPLRATLLDSRQRWRGFGMIAADLMFETDLAGNLTFLAPDPVLGWPPGALLGHPAKALLLDRPAPGREPGPDPFRFAVPVKDRVVWLRDAGGQAVCVAVSSVPLLDQHGHRIGTRGVGVDVTERERRDAAMAASLRRADVLDHILGRMRQEVMAPRMMQAVLDAVIRVMGGRGAAVIDLKPPVDAATQATPSFETIALDANAAVSEPGCGTSRAWPVLHVAGEPPDAVLADALALLDGQDDAVAINATSNGLTLLACPASTRFGERAALVIWRTAGSRTWDADDHILATSVTGVIRIVLEHEAIQRELARQARTDPLTGLLNRRAFLDEAARRIDRLDREGLPGTMLFIDLDRLKPLNDRLGHEAGDAALLIVAGLLRRTVRPTDLVARLGGDEFALWLDGSDEMTAAERAEGLRIGCPEALAHLAGVDEAGDVSPGLTMSIGIACRRSGGGEELDSLLLRADQAMYEVKRAGRGHWRVSHTGPTQ